MARRRRASKAKPARGRPAAPSGDPSTADRLRPWVLGAACALFVAQPLSANESAVSRGDGLPIVMLWIALALFWTLGAIGHRRFPVRFGWTDAAVIILVVLHAIAAVRAAPDGSPRAAVNALWVWVGFGLSFLLARQSIVGGREARAVAAVMVALAVALAGHGLYQYFHELPVSRAQYERDPDTALAKAGVWSEPGSPERELFEKRLYSSEPFATFNLANSLAGYLAPWLVVALGIGFSSLRNRQPDVRSSLSRFLRVLPAAACIALTLFLTKSRTAWLATALGLLLLVVPLLWSFFRRAPARRVGWNLPIAVAISAGILLAVIVAAMATAGLDVQVFTEASLSAGYRIQYWQATLQMIADHPLAGCGPGQFQNTYTTYKLPWASEEIADPHNFLLEVWATAGTPALLALVAVLGCFGWAISRHGRSSPHAEEQPTPTASAAPADATAHVLGGAAFGFLLSGPLGLISSAPPSTVVRVLGLPLAATLLLGLPLAAGSVAMLAGWIKRGRLPAALPVIGVVVLLANLLAAGGIGFPGVAGTLWLLMALSLNMAENNRPRTASPRVAWAVLAAAIALAVACYLTAYGRVVPCRAKIRLAYEEQTQAAEHARRGEHRLAWRAGQRAEEHLLAAAAADPLAAEPWRHLATLALLRWQREPSPEGFERFESCIEKALELDPKSASTWHAFGERQMEAFRLTGGEDHVQKAVAAYRRGVKLYPNIAIYHADLAVALQAAGDTGGFRREAERALWLDEVTPHADKKLPDELRNRLSRSVYSKQ